MAQCVVHVLKGLACRAPVSPAARLPRTASSAQRSRRLRSTRAAAPVLLTHALVTKQSNLTIYSDAMMSYSAQETSTVTLRPSRALWCSQLCEIRIVNAMAGQQGARKEHSQTLKQFLHLLHGLIG